MAGSDTKALADAEPPGWLRCFGPDGGAGFRKNRDVIASRSTWKCAPCCCEVTGIVLAIAAAAALRPSLGRTRIQPALESVSTAACRGVLGLSTGSAGACGDAAAPSWLPAAWAVSAPAGFSAAAGDPAPGLALRTQKPLELEETAMLLSDLR